ncbi:hypothetical protein PICMEDRAFT_121621 [Pichia membranifaciens NRRL Y-2026]|uniref:Uncharacterized protein n=1 Tax=Pichia membranifaciens NRRL Y-2026 TaxID=763406 RepID=A0A1E3NPG2_9ASCO|nr:hypothetical protein PICMEDRAFT_121621 [Pichia membranifaciens NRRL Y-2026]ODQ47945.1 hypothetical protein PICMEDRAFT_121621 [Pichia membranifaciens NRRL Y-2026]
MKAKFVRNYPSGPLLSNSFSSYFSIHRCLPLESTISVDVFSNRSVPSVKRYQGRTAAVLETGSVD